MQKDVLDTRRAARYDVTVMTVTSAFGGVAGSRLSAELRASIDLAVAQYLRSAVGVDDARRRLSCFELDEAEVLRRRRADASDPAVARVLKFAVTAVMTRGRLTATDSRRLLRGADDGDLARAVVRAAGSAYTNVLLLESAPDKPATTDLDLDVGDY